MKKTIIPYLIFKETVEKKPSNPKKSKKLKTLPNKPIHLGGGPFVGRHTTG